MAKVAIGQWEGDEQWLKITQNSQSFWKCRTSKSRRWRPRDTCGSHRAQEADRRGCPRWRRNQ